ncbi:hypothetical protein Pen02_73250 [Plantactinospora endophytica]|uniref:Uncharacterized protein n=1 Tax=Plantactinospora endophytica TaxID=673535 RepID=A0ABQ4ECK3_9ACTN|nr:hypothetical protein Pen02_73250 [Plantactinospora endophytica]
MPPGTVLELAKEDWRYGGHPLRLRVEFVRLDLSTYYDNQWVWISGQRLAQDGSPLGHLDALVRVSALSCPGGDNGRGTTPGTSADGSRTAGRRNATMPRTAPRQRTRQGRGRRSGEVDRGPDPQDEPRQERPGGENRENRSHP